jgi:predicted ATP-dependent protease
VTGSVEMQAVGGVTDKIEGFFNGLQAKGLTGRQGVAIPDANAPNLMLSDEVVRDVEEGRFHVWALPTIDAGLVHCSGRHAA